MIRAPPEIHMSLAAYQAEILKIVPQAHTGWIYTQWKAQVPVEEAAETFRRTWVR